MSPYLNPPPISGQQNFDGYGNISPPLVYAYANPDAASNAYAKYLPYAANGIDIDIGQTKMNGNQQLVGGQGGVMGVRDGQSPWGKPDKGVPAVQYLKEQSGLTLAGSGGSGTLNNAVHKVPKVCLSFQSLKQKQQLLLS